MILYDYFRSSAAYRVRIALNLKGLAYARRDVMLLEDQQRSPEHLARNPQGFVPALEADGKVITQSLAIIEWLDARHPEPRLIPADPDARAGAMARALVIAADTHPLNNLRVMRRLKAMGVDEEERNAWTRHWIAEGFAALEAMAGGGRFLGGDAPGIADLCLVPQMYNARRFETPLDAFPRLVAIDAAATALPAFAAAHPDAVAPK
ncbi:MULTISPECIES: maleylacetoacetate isomerase [unclassified Sphingomonas]|jgi:maleylacetoacetate isomerase|uniref:maleylacetoacetate isomerase n=1 Tax=Sphingomonas TaxID=13687 RepID=UPI0009604D7E|nr:MULTISPECIES: maleylacetoacetate isomerase [unclassified Sphingomonas]MBN8809755.1 maleylacetoacetate isomerase [Sphingomonas sp.]OJY50386.1 MAG: maleylacetoacetate isomerase [Sphingomonas sp. 67-41]